MTGARNVRGGMILLSVGLVLGLAMSLYAFTPMVRVPEALDHYDDVPRRLLRLAHISAIMLPLLNLVLGGWLDRLALSRAAKNAASWLLLAGAAGVPLALAVEAAWPVARVVHLSAGPVVIFCSGVFLVSLGALRTSPGQILPASRVSGREQVARPPGRRSGWRMPIEEERG